jgi:diguanylate cyclase (GGDEF)-like protein
LLGAARFASAQEFKVGDIVISNPWSRATPMGAKVGGGYLVIENRGNRPDRLLGGSVAIAAGFEIHDVAVEHGVMRMRSGLLNRRGFDEAVLAAPTKAHDANMPTTVLMCDIDRFKAINDQFGHEFGDKILVAITNVLRSFAERSQILAARHGGEEFAILMTGWPRIGLRNMRQACAAKAILSEQMSACVTIRIGLVVSQREAGLSKVVRMAHQALYAAKHRGAQSRGAG